MRILIASPAHPEAIDYLSQEHEVVCAFNAPPTELLELIHDKDVLVFRSGVKITREVLRAGKDLQLIVRAGSGLDNIDLEELERLDVTLVRIPGPSARAVAELTFALMLNLSRNILPLDSLLRQGQWAKNRFDNHLLSGKTLGIIGAGNIGARVGQLGSAWGMRCIGCVAEPSHKVSEKLRRVGVELLSLDEIVPQADYLSVNVPLSDATRGLIGADVLGRMKPGSFLINTSRGGVVDEGALYDALRSGGRLRGAGLDVHTQEGAGCRSVLRELPNVVLTPHVGASTVDTQREIGLQIVEIIEAYEPAQAGDEAIAVAQ